MRRLVTSLAAALAALALALALATPAARAADAPRVAIALEKDLGRTVEDALLDARMTLAREPAAAALAVASLAANEGEAVACARDLYFAGRAEALVVGGTRVLDERAAETGASARVEVTLDAFGGRSGDRVLHVTHAERGSAADPARALAKAKRLAGAAAAKRLAEEIRAALERAADLAITIKIADFTIEDRAYHAAALARALQRAGIAGAKPKADEAVRGLGIEARAAEGSLDDVAVRLRAALDAEGLDAMVCMAGGPGAGPSVISLAYRGPRERGIEVRIAGLDPAAQAVSGLALAEAVAAIPGVRGVEREVGPGLVVVRARTRAPLASIDAAIAARRDRSLGALRLRRLDGATIEYEARGEIATFLVDIAGFDPARSVEAGRAVDAACGAIAGLVDYGRERDAATGALRLRIGFRGEKHELDEALLGALDRAGLRSTPASRSPGTDLAYRLGGARSRAARVRVERLSPEASATAGRALLAILSGLDRVRVLERTYDPDTGVLDIAVDAGDASPDDLDHRIWRLASETPELKRLAPGASGGGTIGYLFLDDAPGERAIVLHVENLAREAYETDGRRLLEVVRGIEGAGVVDATYEPAGRRLRVILRYPQPARDFEAALWDALPRRRLWHAVAGPPFSKPLSPDARGAGVVRIVFGDGKASAGEK